MSSPFHKSDKQEERNEEDMDLEKRKVPDVVALVAMGATRMNYVGAVMKAGDPKGVADETWVINKLGCVYKHDLVFRMDDLRVPRKINQRVLLDKDGIDVHTRQTGWMKKHDKPIVTSTAYPEFPTSIAFPLEDVINTIGYSYFLTTPAYAAAFAIHIGVKHLKLYGCDFTYPQPEYRAIAESGKANMEFILAIGMMKGMQVEIAKNSTLLGTNLDISEHLYGYEDPIEVLASKQEGKKYEIKVRTDLSEKKREKTAKLEKAQLQELILKYENDVVRDLIRTKSITNEMIEQYFKDHPEDLNKTAQDFIEEADKANNKKSNIIPLDASMTPHNEEQKGETNNDDTAEILKRSNECNQ